MGHYEDSFWEVNKAITEHNLLDEFNKELDNMESNGEFTYVSVKDRWDIAAENVVSNYKTNNSVEKPNKM
tara:strand:+ start:110 stop:319 length:210 start_codon:yes stop_codon:yes gene_type:complete